MIPKEWIEKLKKIYEKRGKIEVDVKPIEDVESPEQWFVRQIWENITFPCPKCKGSIHRVMIVNETLDMTVLSQLELLRLIVNLR